MIHNIGKISRNKFTESRLNRFYFVLFISLFFIGFFYDSREHVDTYYSNLIKAKEAVKELNLESCSDLNNNEFLKKIKAGDIEFDINLQSAKPNCLNFVDILLGSEHHPPLTEELINFEFEKKYSHYILKKNLTSGLYFSGILLIFLSVMGFTKKVIMWIINGSQNQ